MSRKRCNRTQVVPLPPKGLRPKLTDDQVVSLQLIHIENLDAIASGRADQALLWDYVEQVLTWFRVAEQLQLGFIEMLEQLALVTRLVERYGQHGKAAWTGPDYQKAKLGIEVMDQLASAVDRHTAAEAMRWARDQVGRMEDLVQQYRATINNTAPAAPVPTLH